VSLQDTLARLQIPSDEVVRAQCAPIGQGGFAKVYKARYNGKDCAAKVRYVTATDIVTLSKVTEISSSTSNL
jgi:hypothetical protein